MTRAGATPWLALLVGAVVVVVLVIGGLMVRRAAPERVAVNLDLPPAPATLPSPPSTPALPPLPTPQPR